MPRTSGIVLALAASGWLWTSDLRAQAPPPAKAEATQDAKKPEPSKTPTEAKPEPPKPPADPIDRIKEEGDKRSQVMATLSYLTDVIGPRLTGSPNLKRANEWTRDALAKWGLENAHLEAWGPFGKGWTLKRFSAQVIEPQCIPLIAVPKAWSPSIEGTLTAEVVYFDAKTEADFEKYKGKLKGAVVLTSAPPEVLARFDPLASRRTDKELLDLADAPEPGGRRGRTFDPKLRAQMELASKKTKFLADEGAALLIDPSRTGDGGTLFVQSASVPGSPPPLPPSEGSPDAARTPPPRRISPWDKDAPKIIPQLVMAKEHYNRLVRMIQQGEKIKVAVDLAVEFHGDDLNAYNTVAELPGTDRKDEIVMLGGHIDSWHGGVGATDNAAGVAVAMEAMRILKALDLKPRRTVRIGLWSGEEQGLHGSRAYVSEHFRKVPEDRGGAASEDVAPQENVASKPEYDKFSAYYNLDNGTGKIRGVYLQGNEAARPIFRKWLQPFRAMGATTLTSSNTGGTDHLSFDGVGLPGFQFIQDEVEYGTRTHHSNMDVYDRAQADDLKQAAVIMAAFVYNTAMLDEKLPRKPIPPRANPAVRAAALDAPTQ
ncbi:MAG: M20/M25/M40 family metallo-hydrolase [Paludisphaera borealis]|uniref:M20/M25/M40 family metallo-hydrolase n=1 Tax=Paludisphaera borealis TaxID=1387353 RepID=UPI0028443C2C|nr:M20/M25/M40 family metallo-hydrolase [Paludisphaera borealis]MDR3618496.1 M20/M25/M40 family metallo-hydrolase [Paludisphaera borealis]